jgi:hypothetical protein
MTCPGSRERAAAKQARNDERAVHEAARVAASSFGGFRKACLFTTPNGDYSLVGWLSYASIDGVVDAIEVHARMAAQFVGLDINVRPYYWYEPTREFAVELYRGRSVLEGWPTGICSPMIGVC